MIKLSQASIRYPVTIVMILLSMIVLGGVSLTKLKRDLLPNIQFPELSVHVPYRQATPSFIERKITKPLEEALSTVGHMKRMSSWTSRNSCPPKPVDNWTWH